MNNLRIINGENVDLISPFPLSEVKRMYGWLHCYRTVTESDDSPKTLDEYCAWMNEVLPRVVSFGIIDKNHLTNIKHEAPLVGFGIFEPILSPNGQVRNGLLHVATARRAWKARLIDEAGELAIKDLFEGLPNLMRLSACINEHNSPARGLLRRLGFKMEGIVEDGLLYDSTPQNLALFGLTRRNYNLCRLPLCSPHSEEGLETQSEVSQEASSDNPPLPKQPQE